ncbi:MAG: hypothetical protein ACXQTR_02500 [Candidatus Methanospirareceae archaeon]
MSFDKILARSGTEISQIEIMRTNIKGYIDTSENVTIVNAMVQPLSSEEQLFWSEAGITKAMLKLYTNANVNMNVGDKIRINGEDYTVVAADTHADTKIGGYMRVIVEKHGSTTTV